MERCKNKYLMYTEEDLMNALHAVKKGMPMRAVSQQFKVPFSTIRAKHQGIYVIGKKSGPAIILTKDEENMLADWILLIGNKGFPLTKDMLLDSVKLLLKKVNRKNPFTNGRPGRHCFQAFMKRHPQFSLRSPQNLCERRGQVSEEKIRGWFQEVEVHLKSKNLIDIDPSRVFNSDESAFFLSPKGNKVLTNKQSKCIYNLVGANEKECLTTLITGNAAGKLLPPMIMYSYQRLPSTIIDKVPTGWSVGRSDNGWMTGESFYEYMTNVFHPWCIKNGIIFPIVMYLDGHSSHATMALSNFCVEHEIELISLHPNSTHITQPIDVALFRPLKEAWKKAVTDWRMENGGIAVAKQNFAPILETALQSLNIANILSHGFTECGLAPLSADAINYAKLLNHNVVPQQKNINSNSSTAQHNIHECTLTFIENCTDTKILQLFKVTEAREREWCGEEEYEALFSVWLKCRKLMLDTNVGARNSKSIEVSSVPKADVALNNELISIEFINKDNPSSSKCDGFTVNNNLVTEHVDLSSSSSSSSSFPCIQRAKLEQVKTKNDLITEEKSDISSHALIIDCNTAVTDENACPNKHANNNTLIPATFREVLFWPDEKLPNNNKTKIKREKISAIATSDKWREYQNRKMEMKKEKEEEIEERKKMRLENVKIKKEKDEEKRKLKKLKDEEKARIKNEKDEEKAKLKKLKEEAALKRSKKIKIKKETKSFE